MAPESLYQGIYTTKSDVWVNDYHFHDKGTIETDSCRPQQFSNHIQNSKVHAFIGSSITNKREKAHVG